MQVKWDQGRPWQVRGPIVSSFAGPHSVVFTKIFEERQVIMIEIDDVKDRCPKGKTFFLIVVCCWLCESTMVL